MELQHLESTHDLERGGIGGQWPHKTLILRPRRAETHSQHLIRTRTLELGSFVAMCFPEVERSNGATFYVGKVRALNCVADAEGMMHIIWYWPKMPRGSTDAPGEWHQQYSSCMQRAWVPSREPDDWIFVSSAMTSWKNTTSTLMCMVHGVHVEKEIKIPRGEVHHILLHASVEAQIIDNENMRSI